jgi:predicted nucleic acid-binding protein
MLRRGSAKANLVTDAWYAALAVESGCTWITADKDFARFPKLRWMHPLDNLTPIQNPD